MVPENNISDKRDARRVKAKIDVATYVKNKKLDTCMRNLSCNGIMITDNSESDFEKDQKCEISIPIDGRKELEVSAKVAWVKDGLVGLSFENMDKNTSAKIEQLILRITNQSGSE